MTQVGRARIRVQYDSLALDDLVISESNVRRRDIVADIDELAASIDRIGLLQPLVVRKKGQHYEIVIGQRRYLALKELKWREQIPAIIITSPVNEFDAAVLSFSENIQRRDIAPRDKGDACQQLLETLGTPAAVADYLGVTPQTVRKWLTYATVPEELKQQVEEKRLTRGQASRIWSHVQDKERAIAIAKLVAEKRRSPQQRERILTAVEELPDRSVATILRRAEELKTTRRITFILSERWSQSLDRVAKELDRDVNDIARDAMIEWLQSHDLAGRRR